MGALQLKQIELVLHGSLSQYGLNPNDWNVKLTSPSLQSHHKTISIFHKRDASLSLTGKASVKSFGQVLKAKWLELSWNI